MKFGSVRFFKQLIVAVVMVVVAALVVLAIVLGVLFGRQKKRADWLETVNWALLNNVAIPAEIKDAGDITNYFQNQPDELVNSPSFAYQLQYPELYFTRPATASSEGKVCYLTFDDGPSPVTMQVLKTLADYDVKATFFVTGDNSVEHEAVLVAAAEAGHTIAVHTYSHVYKDIYQSVDAYLADFEKMHTRIQALTGTSSGLFRFPGGSINGYNRHNYEPLIAEMTRRGFTFFDWNAAANDAVEGGQTPEQIVQNVLDSAAGQERIAVLMHDRRENATTAAALPLLIEELQQQGYRFEPLTAEVQPITYFYREQ